MPEERKLQRLPLKKARKTSRVARTDPRRSSQKIEQIITCLSGAVDSLKEVFLHGCLSPSRVAFRSISVAVVVAGNAMRAIGIKLFTTQHKVFRYGQKREISKLRVGRSSGPSPSTVSFHCRASRERTLVSVGYCCTGENSYSQARTGIGDVVSEQSSASWRSTREVHVTTLREASNFVAQMIPTLGRCARESSPSDRAAQSSMAFSGP